MIVSHLPAICCQGRLDWVCVPWCVHKVGKPHKTQLAPKVSLLLFSWTAEASCISAATIDVCKLVIWTATFLKLNLHSTLLWWGEFQRSPQSNGICRVLEIPSFIREIQDTAPIDSGKCHNQLFKKVHGLRRKGDGHKRNTFLFML